MSNSYIYNKILALKKEQSTVNNKLSYIIKISLHSSYTLFIKRRFLEALTVTSLKKYHQKGAQFISPKNAYLQYQNLPKNKEI